MGALTTSEIASKWRKHAILAKEASVHKYLPETNELNRAELLEKYLTKYPSTILKPVIGTGGRGIIKIKRLGNDKFLLQTGLKKRIFQYEQRLSAEVSRLTKHKRYLIQQGINLITINQRPIDFRILLYKTSDKWEYMGGMGKLAAKNKVVTNFCKGGKPISITNALINGINLNSHKCNEVERNLEELGLLVAKTFENQYKSIKELGLDVAIDKDLRIWILEVNTRPMYNLFRYHKDKTLYRRIDSYVKVIRRQKRKLKSSL